MGIKLSGLGVSGVTIDQFVPPPSPTYTPIFRDTFDGTLGTTLVAHPPNIGPAWNNYSGIPGVGNPLAAGEYFATNSEPVNATLTGTGGVKNFGTPVAVPVMIPISNGYLRFGFTFGDVSAADYWEYDTGFISQLYTDGTPVITGWNNFSMSTWIGVSDTGTFYFKYFGINTSIQGNVSGMTPVIGNEYGVEYLFFPDRIQMWLKDITGGVNKILLAQDLVTGGNAGFATQYPNTKFFQHPDGSVMYGSPTGSLSYIEVGTFSGISPGLTTLYLDTFTGTGNISTHTPDIGSAWIYTYSGQPDIPPPFELTGSGEGYTPAPAFITMAATRVGPATSYIAEVDFSMPSTGSNNEDAQVVLRFVDANDSQALGGTTTGIEFDLSMYYSGGSSGGTIRVRDNNVIIFPSSAITAFSSIALNTLYTFRFTISANNYKAYLNNVEVWSYTDYASIPTDPRMVLYSNTAGNGGAPYGYYYSRVYVAKT